MMLKKYQLYEIAWKICLESSNLLEKLPQNINTKMQRNG
jgi:hypothetical protein